MSRARVLHLITHLGVGGATDNTLLTVRDLSREKYAVDLAAGVLQDDDGYTDWTPRGREWADAFHPVPEMARPIAPGRDLRALARLTDLLDHGRYDLVHTHCAKAGILGRLAARRARVPHIVHTYHCFPWKVGGDPAVRGLRRLGEEVAGRAYVAIERRAARFTDALLTVAEINREEAIRIGLAEPGKIRTVCSGIDLDRFEAGEGRAAARHALGLPPDAPVVGTVGRLSVQKDPLTFVAAARAVRARRPDAVFVLAGDGPLQPEVERAAGGDPGILVLGFREDIPRILQALDVFVLSSLWEGLGRALTEAMAVGLPVAATAVDGIPELVRDGETGRLCPARDPALLADRILDLLERPEEARRMGARGRERVRPTYTSRRMVEGIEEVYDRLLAGRPA